MTDNYSTPYTARSVSTAPAHRQAEKFFTANFVQYGDTFATIRNILADYPKFCRFSAENDRLLLADFGAMLFNAMAKSIASRRKLNNLHMANISTPFHRAFFVRGFRTPKENTASNFGFCILLSMVGRNRHAYAWLCSICRSFPTLLRPTAQTVGSLAVALQKSHMELLAMIYQFLGISRQHYDQTKAEQIRVLADNETQARAYIARDYVLIPLGRLPDSAFNAQTLIAKEVRYA